MCQTKQSQAPANASGDSVPAAKKSRKDTTLPEASAASAVPATVTATVTAKPQTITSIVAASNISDDLPSNNDGHTVSSTKDETISTPKSKITEIRPNKNKIDSGEKKGKGTLVASQTGEATLKPVAKPSKSAVASPAEHATPSIAKPVKSTKSTKAPERAKTTSKKVSAKNEKALESGKTPKSGKKRSKKVSAKSPEQLKIALHRSLCRVFQLTLDGNAVDSSPDIFVVKDTEASDYFTPADMPQASFEWYARSSCTTLLSIAAARHFHVECDPIPSISPIPLHIRNLCCVLIQP